MKETRKKIISFSVDFGEYEEIDQCAKYTGLTVSQFCKMASFSHKKRYTQKQDMKNGK